MRTFETGATRDSDDTKPDYEGYMSPLVVIRFGEYMTKHRQTPQGPRDSDNWQKGIPLSAYMKSMWRHLVEVWRLHRGYGGDFEKGRTVVDDALEEALCGVIFNASGYLHEHLKVKAAEPNLDSPANPRAMHWRYGTVGQDGTRSLSTHGEVADCARQGCVPA